MIVSATISDRDWKVLSQSPEETGRLGMLLGKMAGPGTVVGLIGNLGAGKTRFVQGITQGLEIPVLGVTSPTFTLIQEYYGRLPVAHFDTYRLRSPEEFAELGSDEYFSGEWVSLVEWADRVAEHLPQDCLTVRIEHRGESERELLFSAGGVNSAALLHSLKAEWTSTN